MLKRNENVENPFPATPKNTRFGFNLVNFVAYGSESHISVCVCLCPCICIMYKVYGSWGGEGVREINICPGPQFVLLVSECFSTCGRPPPPSPP